MQSLSFKHRGEKCVFVFAISVLVMQDVGGRVRLVPAQSERETHITKILRDEAVKRFGLFQIAAKALGQFVRLGTNFRSRLTAVMVEAGVPAADLLPVIKGGQLNGRNLVLRLFLLLFLFVFVLVSVIVVAFQVRTDPAIDATAI